MAGKFNGEVDVRWVTQDGYEDRLMQLLASFHYEDPRGKIWSVPAGVRVDGASIPRIFWNWIGPPFVGDYRRASVIHDHYCRTRTESSSATHRVFYHGCRTGGVGRWKAKIMYLAVLVGGDWWQAASNNLLLPGGQAANEGTMVLFQPHIAESEALRLRAWVENDDPSLDDIETRVLETLTLLPVEALAPADN